MNGSSAPAHGPHWVCRSAFPLVSLLFFCTQAQIGFAVHRGWWWLAVPLVLVASHFMHGLLIGFHEASHGMLRKNRLINNLDGVILGAFSFMSFTLYQVAHQTHHAHLASERDVELWPLVNPRIPRWLRLVAAFFELTAGVIFTPLLFLRAFLSADSPARAPRVRRRIWAELALSAAMWTGIVWAVTHWEVWSYFLWMYVAPAVIAANLQSWRKYIEHVGLKGSTVNASTRSIVADGWIGRLVAVTLLHEPYHGVHHLCAGVPHAELPRHVSELTPKARDERAPFPSYRHALGDLLRSLANPRAGAQWRDDNKHAAEVRA